jgi:hypothetical protein
LLATDRARGGAPSTLSGCRAVSAWALHAGCWKDALSQSHWPKERNRQGLLGIPQARRYQGGPRWWSQVVPGSLTWVVEVWWKNKGGVERCSRSSGRPGQGQGVETDKIGAQQRKKQSRAARAAQRSAPPKRDEGSRSSSRTAHAHAHIRPHALTHSPLTNSPTHTILTLTLTLTLSTPILTPITSSSRPVHQPLPLPLLLLLPPPPPPPPTTSIPSIPRTHHALPLPK